MTDEEILAGVTAILSHLLDDQPVAPRPEQALRTLPGWNGFLELQLLAVAESRFGVSFDPADTAALQTVGDVVALVAERQGRND